MIRSAVRCLHIRAITGRVVGKQEVIRAANWWIIVSIDDKSLSNNVGSVKYFWGALIRALRRAPFRSSRRFCLCLCLCHTNQGSLVIDSGQETRSDPSISSVTPSIMITTSNSPVKGSGIPNQLLGVQLHTIAISGLSRVSIRACCPRNFMKITQGRRQNGRGFGAPDRFRS